MIILGIETTAHTFGVGIINDRAKVLANEKATYRTMGGIFPREAGEHHYNRFLEVFERALEKAKIKAKDIELISFSMGPGLGPCLDVGATFAKALSVFLKKPIVGINHCVAHVEIGKVCSGFKDPVALYVSGANTQILAYASGRYRVFGETLDIGVGNFLDNFGRFLGLEFPAGPKIEELALVGRKYIELPYTIKGMDFSFGGLLTNLKQKIDSGKFSKEDLCYSAEEIVYSILTEATERAVAHTQKEEVIVVGGVAANKRLCKKLKIMCKERGVKFFAPPLSLAGDNGAMIAWQGYLEFIGGGRKQRPIEGMRVDQFWRTDEVLVSWI